MSEKGTIVYDSERTTDPEVVAAAEAAHHRAMKRMVAGQAGKEAVSGDVAVEDVAPAPTDAQTSAE